MKADESAPLADHRDRPDGLAVIELESPALDAEHGGGHWVNRDLWASAGGAGHFDACGVKVPPDAL